MKYTKEQFEQDLCEMSNDIIELIPSAKEVFGIDVKNNVVELISDIIHHTTGGNIEEGIELLKLAQNDFIEFNKELDKTK